MCQEASIGYIGYKIGYKRLHLQELPSNSGLNMYKKILPNLQNLTFFKTDCMKFININLDKPPCPIDNFICSTPSWQWEPQNSMLLTAAHRCQQLTAVSWISVTTTLAEESGSDRLLWVLQLSNQLFEIFHAVNSCFSYVMCVIIIF